MKHYTLDIRTERIKLMTVPNVDMSVSFDYPVK